MLVTVFDIDKLKVQIKEYEEQLSKPEIYNDFEKSTALSKQQTALMKIVQNVDKVQNVLTNLSEYISLFDMDIPDADIVEINKEIESLKKDIDKLHIESLYSGIYDDCDALFEIHSGAGGEEAQDWAQMLERMYLGYADIEDFAVEVVYKNSGDGAGFKSAGYIFKGRNAYGNLKNERGVHRLVRISPFDSNKRRHTSFASVEVSPIVPSSKIEINSSELKIDTFRSGGAGGQNVNKVESAIRITHIPTGIVVSCQNERSQLQNKEMAMQMLYSKLMQLEEQKRKEKEAKEKGVKMKNEWGSQIRSYVLYPYKMVKDLRTNMETSNTDSFLDGNIQEFIVANLKNSNR